MQNKESKSLIFLYKTIPGRCILKILSSRLISKICGFYLDSFFSKILIKKFVKKHNINLDDYCQNNFKSFNDFFTRKIKEELRPINYNENVFISPCDGLVSAYHITDGIVIPVKQTQYTIACLLKNEELAKKYKDGTCLVIRLCVDNYHRYSYIDDGTKTENIHIKGCLHTVRPIALEKIPVFTENSREYTILHTNNFDDVVQIEVGALLVGKIKNHHQTYEYKKGEEKGTFLYGGSTIILLLKKNCVDIDKKYFENTNKNKETPVKMGKKIGKKH